MQNFTGESLKKLSVNFFKVIENNQEKKAAIDRMIFISIGGNPKGRLWMTNDYYVYKVGEMSTKHIVNCIKCLHGKSKISVMNHLTPEEKLEWVEVFKDELKSRKKT
jgi:hypothetical protein